MEINDKSSGRTIGTLRYYTNSKQKKATSIFMNGVTKILCNSKKCRQTHSAAPEITMVKR